MRERLLISTAAVAIAFVVACASPPPPAPTIAAPLKHGATRASTSSPAGFEAWLGSERRWVDPETFLAGDKSSRPANKWPDASVFPPFEQTKEDDEMLLLTPDGPCEMYFRHTRWRKRADVRAFGAELRTYKACGTVFSRETGFAPAPPPTTPPTTPPPTTTDAPTK